MRHAFHKHFQNLRFVVAAMLTLLSTGCSLHGGSPRATFHFGPVHADMSDLPLAPQTAPSSESRAARLREDLLAPVNRYAPTDKDWRMVRGTDKGPTIVGLGLRFHLQDDEWQMRLGWQRRGSTRMFGPEFTMSFDGK